MRHKSIAFASKKDTGLGFKTEKKPSVMQPGSCNQHLVKQPLAGYYGEIGKQNVLPSPSYTSLNLYNTSLERSSGLT
jgi:hypothetical protein